VSRSKRLANRPPAKPPVAKPAPPQAAPAPILVAPKAKSGDVFGWALPVYLLLLSGGFAFLRSPLATNRGNELGIDRAAFTVINAVTLTGFRQTIGLAELRPPGQIAVFILMTASTILTLIVGGELVTKIVGLPFSNRLIYTLAGIAIPVAALLGAAGLGDTPLHGAFMGVSALGNSGLYISKLPAPDDLSAILILLPLVVGGGLGLPIWLDLYGSLTKRKPLCPQSLISLSMYGAVYVIAVGLLLTQLVTYTEFPAALATCSATAITARSAGFPISSLDQFTRSGQWFLAALMILGPASGGVGGGVKVTTIAVLFRGLKKSYAGDRPGRPFTIAAVWLAGYAFLIFIGFLTLLTYAPPMPGDRLLFLVISAATNVGWSHDPISIVKSALTTLSIIMLIGRMLPMAILWWMSKAAGGTELAVG
jgi:trk system potassium uptake protein